MCNPSLVLKFKHYKFVNKQLQAIKTCKMCFLTMKLGTLMYNNCRPTSHNPTIHPLFWAVGWPIPIEVLITTSGARHSGNCLASKVYTNAPNRLEWRNVSLLINEQSICKHTDYGENWISLRSRIPSCNFLIYNFRCVSRFLLKQRRKLGS